MTDQDPDNKDAPVTERVRQIQLRLDEARQLIPIQRDPALTAVLSEEEEQAAQAMQQRLRAAELKDAERQALREIDRARARQEQLDQLDDMDLADQRDAKLAERQQRRLTDPRLHLIDLYREQRLSSKLTNAMIFAGILWTSWTVHNNLVGAAFPAWADGAGLGLILVWFAAFIVEPLVSIPLVLVMRAQLKSSAYGDTDSLRSPGVILLEAAALTLSLALNSFPYLPVLGTWQGAGPFVSHSLAPIMIMIAVFTHEVLARTHARRIAAAAEECEWLDGARLGGDSRRVLHTMAKIVRLMNEGHLKPSDDGYPAMNQLVRTKRIKVSKATLTAARDGLLMLDRAREDHSSRKKAEVEAAEELSDEAESSLNNAEVKAAEQVSDETDGSWKSPEIKTAERILQHDPEGDRQQGRQHQPTADVERVRHGVVVGDVTASAAEQLPHETGDTWKSADVTMMQEPDHVSA